jgi:hypothetical protein
LRGGGNEKDSAEDGMAAGNRNWNELCGEERMRKTVRGEENEKDSARMRMTEHGMTAYPLPS